MDGSTDTSSCCFWRQVCTVQPLVQLAASCNLHQNETTHHLDRPEAHAKGDSDVVLQAPDIHCSLGNQPDSSVFLSGMREHNHLNASPLV